MPLINRWNKREISMLFLNDIQTMVYSLEFFSQIPHGRLMDIPRLSYVKIPSWWHGRWSMEKVVTAVTLWQQQLRRRILLRRWRSDPKNQTTPSYVAFTDTESLIRDTAKNQVAMNPANTVFWCKASNWLVILQSYCAKGHESFGLSRSLLSLGKIVKNIVVTVSACFKDSQR